MLTWVKHITNHIPLSQYHGIRTVSLLALQVRNLRPRGVKGPCLQGGRTGIGSKGGWLHHLCDRGSRVWEHLAQCLEHSRCSISQVNLNVYLWALPHNTWFNSISSMRDPKFCPQGLAQPQTQEQRITAVQMYQYLLNQNISPWKWLFGLYSD